MGVNSVCKRFFTNRLAVAPVPIAVGMLFVFFVTSSFAQRSDRDLRAKEVNITIRQLGHRLLLQAGDSTSRVLPVTETKEGTFLLKFEHEFVFNHDSLVTLTRRLLPKTEFPSGYTVTVHHCMTAIITFGFQINNSTPDNLPCSGRSQPFGCYSIEIVFPDLYKEVEPQKTGVVQLTEKPGSTKIDPQDSNPIPITPGTDVSKSIKDEITEEPKSFRADLHAADSIPAAATIKESETTTAGYPLINLVYGGMLMLLCATVLIWRFRKNTIPVRVQDKGLVITNEPAPEVSSLGKFLFDVKDQRLSSGNEVISLTDKECRILELLNENFGELIPREALMQKVWINEGVITGRSLDMFVSKLRKKLSSDPALRITNVHGKGYKLVVVSNQ